MNPPLTYFITWTTYGTWLPGDRRGWCRWRAGEQQPRPLLEAWCRDRMIGEAVALNQTQRQKVEHVCALHAVHREWTLHAVSARSNHVHVVVTADTAPKTVRDQLKANATRVLREQPSPPANQRWWARGGDVAIIDGEDALEQVVLYVTEAQDRMDRGK